MYSGRFVRRHTHFRARRIRRHHRPQQSGLIFGGVVIVIGMITLLDNIGPLNLPELWSYWPAILIALGAAKILDGSRISVIIVGFLVSAAGALLLLRNLDIFVFDFRVAWPVALIALGFVMLARALDSNRTITIK